MKNFRAIFIFTCFCLFFAGLAQADVSFVPLKGLAARVGGAEITLDQLNKAVERAKLEMSMSLQGFGSETMTQEGQNNVSMQPDLEITVLDQLIDDILVEQGARDEGVKVSDKEIQDEINALKSRFQSNEEFHKSIAEQGMTIEDLKKSTRRQLLVKGLEKILMCRIAVSDEEIRSFYDKNIDLFIQPKKVDVADILVKDDELARAIRASLEAGADFSEMASTYSADFRTRAKGGDLGFISVGELDPMVEKNAFHLAAGEISDVITTDDGFHIIKVLSRVPGKETSFEDARENIRGFILKEKAGDAFAMWLESRRTSTRIEINQKLKSLYEGRPTSDQYFRAPGFSLSQL